jgi:hypothetical protein
MNLWLRLFWLALALLWRRKLDPRHDVSRLTFRVLPTDLDLNGHMNNGRYLTIMDLGGSITCCARGCGGRSGRTAGRRCWARP